MKVTKEIYRSMNKAYNAIYDGWQSIEECEPEINLALNNTLVALDQILDVIKEAVPKEDSSVQDISGFKVI